MPRFNQARLDTRDGLKGHVVPNHAKMGHGRQGIFLGVDGLQRRFILFSALFIKIFDIIFLDVSRVAQHDIRQIDRGVGGVNFTFETLLDQVGNVATMVDVGMRENHRVNFRGIKGEVQIREVGLFAPALKSATFQQKFFATVFNQRH